MLIDNINYLADSSVLRPNFWRAPTDNDYGAHLERRFAVWENPIMPKISVNTSVSNKCSVVSYEYDMRDVKARLVLTYTINEKGQIRVNQRLKVSNDSIRSHMFRFGMRMEMPESFDRIDYFGRGPIENYADRKLSQPIGHYAQSVEEQYYPYIRPQETGTKSDLRRYAVTDIAGRGLQFTSTKLFSASALPYTMENLCPTKEKRQYHSTDLKAEHLTAVCIDGAQMGMGCVNSWGAWPLPQYCLPFGPYEFEFVITPVK